MVERAPRGFSVRGGKGGTKSFDAVEAVAMANAFV
jgi:hypothetical protein